MIQKSPTISTNDRGGAFWYIARTRRDGGVTDRTDFYPIKLCYQDRQLS